MKLATFTHGGTTRIGVVAGDSMIDLAAAAPELPREMAAFLTAGRPALEACAQGRARQRASPRAGEN